MLTLITNLFVDVRADQIRKNNRKAHMSIIACGRRIANGNDNCLTMSGVSCEAKVKTPRCQLPLSFGAVRLGATMRRQNFKCPRSTFTTFQESRTLDRIRSVIPTRFVCSKSELNILSKKAWQEGGHDSPSDCSCRSLLSAQTYNI